MKPCDCKSMQEVDSLSEKGLGFNNYRIEIDSIGVFLTIEPYVRIKIPRGRFAAFAKWYLSDQQNGDA